MSDATQLLIAKGQKELYLSAASVAAIQRSLLGLDPGRGAEIDIP
jgi:hypothetical protein